VKLKPGYQIRSNKAESSGGIKMTEENKKGVELICASDSGRGRKNKKQSALKGRKIDCRPA
jgi:hypothetical protein